jgi:hypothetical protein
MERPLECSAEQPQKWGVEAHHRAKEVGGTYPTLLKLI